MKQYFFISYIFLCIIITSCSTSYYYPSHHNILNYKTKNELMITAGLTPELIYHASAGYTFSPNVFINTSIIGNSYIDGGFWFGEKGGSVLWTNEVGYFKNLKNFIPALNVGYTTGRTGINDYYSEKKFSQYYLLPSFGYSNKNFDLGISYKLSQVQFYSNQKNIKNKIFEPCITFGFNISTAKLRYQYSFFTKYPNEITTPDGLHTLSLHIKFINPFKSNKKK